MNVTASRRYPVGGDCFADQWIEPAGALQRRNAAGAVEPHPALSLAAGATVSWTTQALTLNNGTPVSGQSVAWQPRAAISRLGQFSGSDQCRRACDQDPHRRTAGRGTAGHFDCLPEWHQPMRDVTRRSERGRNSPACRRWPEPRRASRPLARRALDHSAGPRHERQSHGRRDRDAVSDLSMPGLRPARRMDAAPAATAGDPNIDCHFGAGRQRELYAGVAAGHRRPTWWEWRPRETPAR